MYSTLIIFHSIFRWLVLGALLFSIGRAYIGYKNNKLFSSGDDSLRHWTATIAHIQLIVGVMLYIKSPVVQYLWGNFGDAAKYPDAAFFTFYHFLLMIVAVVLITIGSALAKRKTTDKEKFKTMLLWFSIVLLLIFIAIPWPFSPFANRPYFRSF
jgi:hypothetical protein